jgi:hypothetical protein
MFFDAQGMGGTADLPQQRLREYCDQDFDIIMLAFVTQFQNDGEGGWWENVCFHFLSFAVFIIF